MCSWKHLQGIINKEILEKSLITVINRHNLFKTEFEMRDGEPHQKVAATVKLDFSVMDFSGQGPGAGKKARDFLEKQAKIPFDLLKDVLIRFYLVKIAENEHIVMFNWHHILTDGDSTQLLWREIMDIYNVIDNRRLENEDTTSLKPIELHYHDYALWQRKMFEQDGIKTMEAYWLKEFAGELPILNLPTDFTRPEVQSYDGAIYKYALDSHLVDRLKKYNYFKMSLFSRFLAAYYILLSKYTGQDDMIIGVFFNGRHYDEKLSTMLGYLANTAAVRIQAERDVPFPGFLRQQVTGKSTEAYNNQNYPLEEILKKINPERDPGRPPLFQVMFNLQTEGKEHDAFAGLEEKEYNPHVDVSASQYELTLFIYQAGDKVQLNFEYCTALFKRETIERMALHYKNILDHITANSEFLLKEIPFLSAEERNRLLEIFNDAQNQSPAQETVIQLIGRRVEQIPHAVAVTYGLNQLSYRQLDIRSTQLAHYLASLGSGEGSLMGISMERSLDLVIAILGIMKAGGVYVPIDPQYPPNRIRHILEDAKLRVLLTKKKHRQKYKAITNHVISMDYDWEKIPGFEKKALPVKQKSDGLVYVIYTSGSSGKPKGVGVFQRGFSNLLRWFSNEFNITRDNSVLLISSLSFDLTQKNIFTPLMVGAKLHLAPSSEFFDPEEILDSILDKQVTWLNCTPSVFYTMIDNVSGRIFRKLTSLRYLFLGGEPVSMTKLSKWIASDSFKTEIVNTYGPTECTDIASYYRIGNAREFQGDSVPMGKPVFNTRLFILGPGFELLPLGVPGEIFIAGAGVGAGYINDATRTVENFTANPFSVGNDKILYKTGDLGKYLPDGNIQCLGRKDQQVKIRGFRIELKEIEARVNKYDSVRECIVLLRENEDAPGIKRLVAYITLKPNASLKVPGLQNYLREELPDYMVPDDFIIIERLPLSPHGKVDLKRLPPPNPGASGAKLNLQFEPPRSPVENELSNIIMEKTGLKKIGIHDNFFFLGIHSLLAAQIILLIREKFAVNLPIYTIFKTPTIAGLAETVMKEQNTGPGAEINRKIAAIWGNILKLNPGEIDVTADFFQLGGNSIKALLMIPEIAGEFNLNLLVMDVYEFNTLEKMSKHLSEKLKL